MDCRRHPSRTYVRTLVKLGPTARTRRRILFVASAVGRIVRSVVALDRVQERRRAAALARHYRDEEGLPIAEIARRLGRAEATVKAYLYDPSQADKRPRRSPRADSSQPPTPSWAGVLQPRDAAARDRRHRCCQVRWRSTAPD
jgi:sigma-70-like protein